MAFVVRKRVATNVCQPFIQQRLWVRGKSKLNVVLTASTELGTPGQVIQVAPGHARNKLLPQKLALPAIKKYIQMVQTARQAISTEENVAEVAEHKVRIPELISTDDILEEAEIAARRLNSSRLSIRRSTPHKSNDVGFPVTVSHIIYEVKRQLGIVLQKDNVVLPEPLTRIGEYEVPLKLPKEVKLPGELEEIRLDVKLRRK